MDGPMDGPMDGLIGAAWRVPTRGKRARGGGGLMGSPKPKSCSRIGALVVFFWSRRNVLR